MALDANSTIADAYAQLNANLRWHDDITKARNCLEAIDWLVVNRPQNQSSGPNIINYAALENLRTDIQAFVQAGISDEERSSFTEGRMLID